MAEQVQHFLFETHLKSWRDRVSLKKEETMQHYAWGDRRRTDV